MQTRFSTPTREGKADSEGGFGGSVESAAIDSGIDLEGGGVGDGVGGCGVGDGAGGCGVGDGVGGCGAVE